MEYERWEKVSTAMAYLFGGAVAAGVLMVLVILGSHAWKAFQGAFLGCLVLGALAGCITDGDFGAVAVVPVQDSCRVKVREHGLDSVQNVVRWEMWPCEGEGHDVEVFGRRWW